MTVCEALRMGLPVAATDVGGLRELVRDGMDGWLCADNEEAICELMRDVVVAHRADGLPRPSFPYDEQSVVDEHLALLGVE